MEWGELIQFQNAMCTHNVSLWGQELKPAEEVKRILKQVRCTFQLTFTLDSQSQSPPNLEYVKEINDKHDKLTLL